MIEQQTELEKFLGKYAHQEINIRSINEYDMVEWAFKQTARGANVSIKPWEAYRIQHSPIRERRFAIEATWEDSVHTHFVRHHAGTGHYVGTHRPDRKYDGPEGRNALRNHGITTNADELIYVARKRLCRKAEEPTRSAMLKIREQIGLIEPDGMNLKQYLVPDCVYRNGMCAEGKRFTCGCIEQVMQEYAYYGEEMGFVRI